MFIAGGVFTGASSQISLVLLPLTVISFFKIYYNLKKFYV